MKLNEIKNQNHKGALEVLGFEGPAILVERLHELGFHTSCRLEILGKAPLNGPMLVELNSMVVALRDEESACLLIQKI